MPAARSPAPPVREPLARALDVLERHLSGFPARAVRAVREPALRPVRIPLGLLLVAASAFWFLPVVGIELLPLGLLVLAQDIPFLCRPVGGAVLWLELRALRALRWWRERSRPARRS